MRVLVVEDEKLLAKSVKRGLVEHGFAVDMAHDGITGEWMASENAYDVVVLDIMLPGLNGYDVLKNLRERGMWAPVMMLTAKDGEYDQSDAFDLGADDYLTKPFSFVVLVARLNALVRRGAPERPVELTVGDVVLDPRSRRVTCRGREVSLTSREFAILHFLMRNQGAVVSKGAILANVWDDAYEGSANIVEVYIGYLRKKLDVSFDRHSLETVRGAGYRMLAVTTSSYR